MGCAFSQTTVQQEGEKRARGRKWSSHSVDPARPEVGVKALLDRVQPGDVVSFIYMQGSRKGQRRDVTFIAKKTFSDGTSGFTAETSPKPGEPRLPKTRQGDKATASYEVAHCREMYLPKAEGEHLGRQLSLSSDGTEGG